MTDMTARDAKLIQYLNEAYAMEMHLETALQAHISMTTDTKYRQRLKEHLTETRRHGRDVRQRVKRLGGTPETLPVPGPDIVSEAAGALLGGAEKAVALAQGPLHALRGTSSEEKQLKNAKTEYASEAQEIATYRGIEALAGALGDKDIAQLARTIGREEERMSSFLAREIPRLAKAVVGAEIPAGERRGATRKGASRKASGSSKAASARGRSRTKAKATKAKGAAKATRAAKKTARGAKAATRGAKAATRSATKATRGTKAMSRSKAKATGRPKAKAGSRAKAAGAGARGKA